MATMHEHGLLPRWTLLRAASIDSRLSRSDLAVLIAVLDRMNKDGVAWPGLAKVAADAFVNRSSAVRSVKRLADCGYLLRESGTRTTPNRYRIGSPDRCEVAPRRKSASRRRSAPEVGASSYMEVGAAVHPEPTHKNLPIEPSAALAADALRPTDPIWGKGVRFLIAKGTPEKQARGFLGQLCKRVGQLQAIALLAQAEEEDIVAPVEWLSAAAMSLRGRTGGRLQRDRRSEEEIARANEAVAARLEALA